MVVGAEEAVSSSPPKGALGQRGVVGTPASQTEPGKGGQSVLRSASNPEGVIGAPRNKPGSETRTGDAGLGRNAVGSRQRPDREAGRAAGPTDNEQHRASKKQRRDVPQKSD
jgi:hypothetical protein